MKNEKHNNNIKKLRLAAGLTQGDMAKLLGHKNSNRIYKIEAGSMLPRPSDTFALCVIFNKSLHNLYPGQSGLVTSRIQRNARKLRKELKPTHSGSSTLYRHRLSKLEALSQFNKHIW